jgi:hypothetical protein
VRFDYFSTVNRLWTDNFMRPIYEWCGRHNLLFTGHHWEHGWPSLNDPPQVMSSLRWMQAPGTDFLGFQFKPTSFADQARGFAIYTIFRHFPYLLGTDSYVQFGCAT